MTGLLQIKGQSRLTGDVPGILRLAPTLNRGTKKKHAIVAGGPGNLSGESLCKRGPYICPKALVHGKVQEES